MRWFTGLYVRVHVRYVYVRYVFVRVRYVYVRYVYVRVRYVYVRVFSRAWFTVCLGSRG